MSFFLERLAQANKALLIGIRWAKEPATDASALLAELVELVNTLGVPIGAKLLVTLRRSYSEFLLGQGKVEEIVQRVKKEQFDLIVFDHDLSPTQQRNWEKVSEAYVVDRQEVILDIFSQRAQTKEAVLQVELACLEYALPRLKRAWTHLSRQRGGRVTLRGMGEKQIEVDQRLVRDRIAQLKAMLGKITRQRSTQRKRRKRIPLPTGAIVGYTNAGKSSLLNALTGADALAEDKLFATLDPLTRRLVLPSGQAVLLTDTVGFIRRLPHRLIDAFKATLEEAVVADFLLHIVDVTNPEAEQHMATTQQVLQELGADHKKTIIVYNKLDLLPPDVALGAIKAHLPQGCFISTQCGTGLSELLRRIEDVLADTLLPMHLLIPYSEYAWAHRLHQMGAVLQEKALDNGVLISGNIPYRLLRVLAPYTVDLTNTDQPHR